MHRRTRRAVITWSEEYRTLMRARARALHADGCSGVPDFYLDACLEHDVHYRTHRWLSGLPLTRRQADACFRRRMQQTSLFGWFSPMALWRWGGVRLFGERAWETDDMGSPWSEGLCGPRGTEAP
jgi:hypothetical protein